MQISDRDILDIAFLLCVLWTTYLSDEEKAECRRLGVFDNEYYEREGENIKSYLNKMMSGRTIDVSIIHAVAFCFVSPEHRMIDSLSSILITLVGFYLLMKMKLETEYDKWQYEKEKGL